MKGILSKNSDKTAPISTNCCLSLFIMSLGLVIFPFPVDHNGVITVFHLPIALFSCGGDARRLKLSLDEFCSEHSGKVGQLFLNPWALRGANMRETANYGM